MVGKEISEAEFKRRIRQGLASFERRGWERTSGGGRDWYTKGNRVVSLDFEDLVVTSQRDGRVIRSKQFNDEDLTIGLVNKMISQARKYF